MAPPPSRRIPALDDSRIVAWIDSRRVICDGGIHGRDYGQDLETGKPIDLPGRPSAEFRQHQALPSADGRWLLYADKGPPPDDHPRHCPVRFRLCSLSGGPDRLIPADGRFTLPPLHYVVWLPDSQGWVTVYCDIYDPVRLTRYRLKGPEVPQPLKIAELPEYGDEIQGHWIAQMTPRGELALSDPKDWRALHFIDVVGKGTIRSVYLRVLALKKEQHPLAWQDFGRLSPDGRYLVVAIPDSETSGSVWRLPVETGISQRLFSLDQRIAGLYLGPDARTLVYQVYTRENGNSSIHAYVTMLPASVLGAR